MQNEQCMDSMSKNLLAKSRSLALGTAGLLSLIFLILPVVSFFSE